MIKELTYEEAARLRELVKNRFLQSPFNGAGFRVSQHRDSYRPLADDIIRAVPDGQASVTTNRLRKLFYYTDPEVCAPDKLEKPSFGDDFIQVLFKYIEEEPKPKAHVPKPRKFSRNWLWRGAALLLFLVTGIAVWLWLERPKYWEETFDDVSVEGLKSRGWEILDYDSVALSKQIKQGYLTLYTYPGDYWVKEGEEPKIKNLLIKRLETSKCKLVFRLFDFYPNQNWQGAGIYLFGSELDRQNFFRVDYGFNHASYWPYWFGGKPTYEVQSLHIIKYAYRQVEDSEVFFRFVEFEPQIKEVGVLLEIRGRRIIVKNWHGDELSTIREQANVEINLPFTPAYIGLGASQGFTNEKGEPLGADTIPAFFDYLKVEPLPE